MYSASKPSASALSATRLCTSDPAPQLEPPGLLRGLRAGRAPPAAAIRRTYGHSRRVW